MLLNELTDQQVAGAFIPQDPAERQKDNAMNPQQLANTQAQQYALDKQSQDPLTQRIVALRAQLAQLLIQQQAAQKAAAQKAAQSSTPAGTTPATGTVAPGAAPTSPPGAGGAPTA